MKTVSENFLRQQKMLQSGRAWKKIYLTKNGTTHEITSYLRHDGLGQITHQLERDLNEFVADDVTVICINDDVFFNSDKTGLFDDLSSEIVCRIDLGLEFATDTVEYFEGWIDAQSVKRVGSRMVQFRAKGYLEKHELYNAEEIKDPDTGSWYEHTALDFLVDKLFEQAEIPEAGREIYVEPIDTQEAMFSYYSEYQSNDVCHAIVEVPSGDPDLKIYYAGLGRKLLRIEECSLHLQVHEIFTVPEHSGDHWIDKLWCEDGYIWMVDGWYYASYHGRAGLSIWRVLVQDPPGLDVQEFPFHYQNYCPTEGLVMDYPKLYFTETRAHGLWLKMRYFDCSAGTFHTIGSQLDGKCADRAGELDEANGRYFLRTIDYLAEWTWAYFDVMTGAYSEIGTFASHLEVYQMEYHPTDDDAPRIYLAMSQTPFFCCINLTDLSFETVLCNTIRHLQYDPLSQELYFWPLFSREQKLWKLRNKAPIALPDALLDDYGCYHPPLGISANGWSWGIAHNSISPDAITTYLPFTYRDQFIPYVDLADFTDYSNRQALNKLAEAFKCAVIRPAKGRAIFTFRNRRFTAFSVDNDFYFADPPLQIEHWGHKYDGVILNVNDQEFTAGDIGYGKTVLSIKNAFIPTALGTEVAEYLLAFFGTEKRWIDLEGVFLIQLELMDPLQIMHRDETIPAFIYTTKYDDRTKRVKISALEDV